MFYTLRSEKETSSEKLIPSKDELRKIEKISSKNVKIEVRPAEKELFLKFRHYLVLDKKHLVYFLSSLTQQYND